MTSPALARGSTASASAAQAPYAPRLRREIRAVDALVISGAIAAALWLTAPEGRLLDPADPRLIVAGSLLVAWLVALAQVRSTATTILGLGLEEYRRVAAASAWAVTFAAALAFLLDAEVGRSLLVVGAVLGVPLLLVARHLMRLRLHRHMGRGNPLHRVFLIAPQAREPFLRSAFDARDWRFRVVGSWHLDGQSGTDPRDIVGRAEQAGSDLIVYAPMGTEDVAWTRQLGWAMEESDLALLVSPSLVEIAGPRLSMAPVEGVALVRVDMPRFSGPARAVKRGVDIAGATLGLALLGLPMLVIAWLVRRDSPGPAIFKQVRAGERGATFECWKFRTMYTGADGDRAALRAAAEQEAGQLRGAAGSATFKMADDPRITRIGRSLRRYSVDELPQLVNVLRGEMSLVGPRPHPLDDVERYDDMASRRLRVKPGMTGLWQVSGRSDLDWDQAVRLDLYYVENWSLASDVLILLRTVKVVLTGSGSY